MSDQSWVLDGKYVWILGGGQLQIPSIDVAHSMGLQTIVSDRDPGCVCRDRTDVFHEVDIFDIQGHMDVLKGRSGVVGVLAAGIDCPETAAVMQTYLGKPTAPPHIAHLCHHKDLFRKAQRQLGYLTPRTPSDNPDLPLWIIKPTDGSGSRGTTILTNIQRCFEKARYTAATDRAKSVSSDGGVVVEECLKGTEHTVETLFDAYGIFHPCFITDRMFTYMGGYPVETGLRHPSTLPDYLQRKAYQIAENMGRDLGVDRGPFKLDIMVTDGGVYVLEATTRFSGGWDSQLLVPAATGKEVLKAGILTCMGRDGIAPLLRPKWNKVGVSVSIWPNPGVITSITGVSDATLSHPGVVDVILRKGVGDTVTPYTDCTKRVGWVFAVAENEESAWRIVNEAASLIHVETV